MRTTFGSSSQAASRLRSCVGRTYSGLASALALIHNHLRLKEFFLGRANCLKWATT